jgi:hypothetical protein
MPVFYNKKKVFKDILIYILYKYEHKTLNAVIIYIKSDYYYISEGSSLTLDIFKVQWLYI